MNYIQTPRMWLLFVVFSLSYKLFLFIKKPKNLCCLHQSTAATLTGKNGARVVAPVDKASRKESDCATTQNQPTGADHAAGPLSTQGNAMLDSVQVKQSDSLSVCVNYSEFMTACYI